MQEEQEIKYERATEPPTYGQFLIAAQNGTAIEFLHRNHDFVKRSSDKRIYLFTMTGMRRIDNVTVKRPETKMEPVEV